jgi:hypothetical protein
MKYTVSNNRNPVAGSLHNFKGGTMKHRCAPKGGSRNTQRDLLDEAEEELMGEKEAEEVAQVWHDRIMEDYGD